MAKILNNRYMKTLKVIILVVTFLIIFWVNIPALFQPCNWRITCPDFMGVRIIAWYPNFYAPEACGGIAGLCYPSFWSIRMIIFDLVLWAIVSSLLIFLISKSKISLKIFLISVFLVAVYFAGIILLHYIRITWPPSLSS